MTTGALHVSIVTIVDREGLYVRSTRQVLSRRLSEHRRVHCKILWDIVDIIPLTHDKIFKIGARSKLVDVALLTTV